MPSVVYISKGARSNSGPSNSMFLVAVSMETSCVGSPDGVVE